MASLFDDPKLWAPEDAETSCQKRHKGDDNKAILAIRLSHEHLRAAKTVAFLSGIPMSSLIEEELIIIIKENTDIKNKGERLKMTKKNQLKKTSISISKATYQHLKLFSFEQNLTIQLIINAAMVKIYKKYNKEFKK